MNCPVKGKNILCDMLAEHNINISSFLITLDWLDEINIDKNYRFSCSFRLFCCNEIITLL